MTARSLLSNAASLTIGRMLLSLGRLGATLLVARTAGADVYGEYALVLGVVFLCEWLADFGQTDIAVRDRGQVGTSAPVATLRRLKFFVAPVAAIILPALILALGYPEPMVLAALAGMGAVLATALLQPWRAQLRIEGRQHVDIGTELAGFVLMIILLVCALLADLRLWALIGASSASRILQLVLVWRMTSIPIDDVATSERGPWHLGRVALPLGLLGLLVLVYELSAPVILSQYLSLTEVGLFMAAFRLVAPTVIVSQAVTQAFFPVLSAAWPAQSDVLLPGQDAVLLLCALSSAIMAAAAYGGAEALMGLFGADFLAAAGILRVLAIVVFLRAITAAMSPLLVIANRHSFGLWLTSSAVALQLGLLVILVPQFGLIGAALGYLVVEATISTVGVWLVATHVSGVRPDWTVPLRFGLALITAAAVTELLGYSGTWVGFFMTPVLLLLLAVMLGVLTRQRGSSVAAVLARRASVE
ncbi:lipopolysaccharide biosynthesis protein [Aliiroseovarius sp. PrR006]|uniref:lipopolysaccharide biosynthesis protein n=1 Tax=Aliiroseovarius sp. PrR006 TaxID=2706883 RepID=UPI0013D2AD8D|nr:lipopolysaccharide biosynthesis protein [Aliiroseovarius sp. PrR006]NDW52445.1 lipopolysaccharide biosynthesis protein [Aliiroseovarius sp. PrR006]